MKRRKERAFFAKSTTHTDITGTRGTFCPGANGER